MLNVERNSNWVEHDADIIAPFCQNIVPFCENVFNSYFSH